MPYRQEQIRLRLLSPCFLGDAEQKGVWRTPPLKALLREWWRIAAAPHPQHNYQHDRVRETEGLLFGNAWLESGSEQKSRYCKSAIRMGLNHWDEGKLRQHTPLPKVPHPEAEKAGKMVEPLNYLGYGPIDKGQFKHGAALQADERNTLALAWPDTDHEAIVHTLQLIDWFGTIGGRCRNGWGSLDLGREPLRRDHPQLTAVLRPLEQCLELDWPHAIGQDKDGPLVWESPETFDDWKDAMRFLARTKIGFRTHFRFEGGKPHRQPQTRHVLAYPVTNHDVAPWGREARLANQLRFKLVPAAHGRVRARIYHTPCRNPQTLPMPNLDQRAIWQTLHRWLDTPANGLERLKD